LWLRELDADGNEYRYYVCNPATRELATLPTDRDGIDYVGFYRHAPTAEYRVLGYKYASSSTDTEDHYEYLLAVPGQERARELVSTSVWMPDVNSMLYNAPVIHRGCLHWMAWPPSDGAVVFDTISEEFRRMRGPDAGVDIRTASTLHPDGTLGASVFVRPERKLKVWVLESYEEEAWALGYNIDVGFLDQGFLGSVLIPHVSDEGDAILVPSDRKRVSVYNLRRGKVVSASQDRFRCNLNGTEHVYQESLVSPATKVLVTQLHNTTSCDWMHGPRRSTGDHQV
jgi:F-box interacting protein